MPACEVQPQASWESSYEQNLEQSEPRGASWTRFDARTVHCGVLAPASPVSDEEMH